MYWCRVLIPGVGWLISSNWSWWLLRLPTYPTVNTIFEASSCWTFKFHSWVLGVLRL